MDAIKNPFKHALQTGKRQIGLWAALADPYVIEVLATAGFDWLLIDNEHAPNDVRTTLSQLQALAAYPTAAVVRPAHGDTALIKKYLDIGVQTLLVPMVDSAEQAQQVVAATRYSPRGVRGVGSSLARASRWNAVPDYLHTASDELCVLVQAESTMALQNLATIARVDGVDGVFFGPSDLSASMGLIGQSGAAAVRKVVGDGIRLVHDAGKAAGVLTSDVELAKEYLAAGATFVAVGSDIGLLRASTARLLAAYRGG
ncbi:MAG: aldolase/citrate lyase family protein [Gammaproteobacteria bacterium]